jgi:hypothetical protein
MRPEPPQQVYGLVWDAISAGTTGECNRGMELP